MTTGQLIRSAPPAPRPLFAGVSLRLRVRLRAAALEGELAAGADPIERADLARCSDLLTRPSGACLLRDGCGPVDAASPPGSLEAAVGGVLHALHDSP